MDFKKQKKRHSIKVIISEAIMVFTIIVTVIILAFLASGYGVNSDFEVERQGMLQISSSPTGATVEIDGETAWFQITNTSKVLVVGEHTVKLTKDGYDSWSKTINISEGLLYRIHYPRLFLNNRTKEQVLDTAEATRLFFSDDSKNMLIFSGDSFTLDTTIFANPTLDLISKKSEIATNWASYDLSQEKLERKTVTYNDLFDFFEVEKKTQKTEQQQLKEFGFNGTLSGNEKLFFSTFYDDDYLTIVNAKNVTVFKKDNNTPVLQTEISFLPEKIEPGHNGEFMTFSAGAQIATLDMETLSIREWQTDGDKHAWLDTDMLYSIKDGELFIYDFDGLNRRSLATGVSYDSDHPVFIINNQWLYYFSDTKLTREWLVPR